MIFRVGIGAALSMIDAATDIYVISTYYQSYDLLDQAGALLAMICTNLITGVGFGFATYQKKSWPVKIREAVISLFFLRPAVDAYRVSTNSEDNDIAISRLSEMIANKVSTHRRSERDGFGVL